MDFLTNPHIFNFLVLTLYCFAIIRWAVERNRANVLYWINAFGLTFSITFLFENPDLAQASYTQALIIPAVMSAFALVLFLNKKWLTTFKSSVAYQILIDPKLFNYLILVVYAITTVRWIVAMSPPNITYWLFAFGITYTVTFEFDRQIKKEA